MTKSTVLWPFDGLILLVGVGGITTLTESLQDVSLILKPSAG